MSVRELVGLLMIETKRIHGDAYAWNYDFERKVYCTYKCIQNSLGLGKSPHFIGLVRMYSAVFVVVGFLTVGASALSE